MTLPLLLFHNQGKGRPVGGGAQSYLQKIQSIQTANQILYHPMNEPSGAVAIDYSPEGNNGAYTGVTLGQTGIGDGETCPLFDGTNDYNDIYSAAFNSDFSGAEGTLALWARVSGAGVWTDGTLRRFAYIAVNTANRVTFLKLNGSNQIQIERRGGGTEKSVVKTSFNPTTWFHLAITWSEAADEVKAYVNGSQEGSTQTSIGTWVGNLASTTCCIGAESTTPTLVFDGYEAHAVVWKVALSAAEVLEVATL